MLGLQLDPDGESDELCGGEALRSAHARLKTSLHHNVPDHIFLSKASVPPLTARTSGAAAR